MMVRRELDLVALTLLVEDEMDAERLVRQRAAPVRPAPTPKGRPPARWSYRNRSAVIGYIRLWFKAPERLDATS